MPRRPSSARVPESEQTEQKAAYDEFIKPLAGAPEYDGSLLVYARYKPFPGETWDTYKARIDMSMAGADAALDVRRAIWEPKKFEALEYDDHDQRLLTADVVNKALAKTDETWSPDTASGLAAEVLEQLAFILPGTNVAPPAHVDPATQDFVWAAARCVFAGAGYSANARIADKLTSNFPSCPFVRDATPADWAESLDEAHRMSGMPATLAWLPWKSLKELPDCDPDMMLPAWLMWRAWIHVLTYVRLEQTEPFLRICYRGVTRLTTFTNSNKLGDWQNKNTILTNLGCPPQTSKKWIHPITKAVSQVLRILSVNQLLPVRSLAALPPHVLWGRWSTVVPVAGNVGFADHGQRLSGVWVANDGVISEFDGEDDDIVGYEWNIMSANADDVVRARKLFEQALPSTYEQAWPSDVLLKAFENLNTTHHIDAYAWRAVLDHVIFAALMRNDCDFAQEFPLVCALPTDPRLERSTNQGKTAFALAIAQAMLPAVDGVTKTMDSNSSPDMRACAEKIRAYGTVCLDEWYPPSNKGHLLSRDNLQTLCTGGTVLAGRVLENTTDGISLKQSLTLSSKALDFAPDLINRSLFFFLDQLTESQRADADVIRALSNGTIALRMRLGALAFLEKYNLVELFNSLSKPGGVYRFPGHRALANILYGIRCTEAGVPGDPRAVDQVILEMRNRHSTHTNDAEEFGTLASLESGKELKLRVTGLFYDLTGNDLEHMRGWMLAHAESPGSHRGSPSKLLRSWLSLRGSPDAPLGLAVQFMTGKNTRVSDRLVSNLFTDEIRATLPVGTVLGLPAPGWVLKRHADRGRAVSVSLEHVPKLATGELRLADVPVE